MKRHHYIAIAVIIFALLAVMVGLDNPRSTTSRVLEENSAAARQTDDADTRSGFPDPPRSDDPPRGPG